MKLTPFLLLALMLIFSACSSYTPYQATANMVGKRRGKACSSYILGFHGSGRNHIYAAARSGKIKKIATVDKKMSGIFPFYWKSCTYVSGN